MSTLRYESCRIFVHAKIMFLKMHRTNQLNGRRFWLHNFLKILDQFLKLKCYSVSKTFFNLARDMEKSAKPKKALNVAIFSIIILRDSPFNPYLGSVDGHEKAPAQAHSLAVVHTVPLTLTLAV